MSWAAKTQSKNEPYIDFFMRQVEAGIFDDLIKNFENEIKNSTSAE